MNNNDESLLLVTVKEACRLLRVGRNTLVAYEQAGHLRPVDIGRPGAQRRTLRYRRADLEQLAGASRA